MVGFVRIDRNVLGLGHVPTGHDSPGCSGIQGAEHAVEAGGENNPVISRVEGNGVLPGVIETEVDRRGAILHEEEPALAGGSLPDGEVLGHARADIQVVFDPGGCVDAGRQAAGGGELETYGGDMGRHEKMFQLQTHSGEAVSVGDATVTPQSQALILRWPNGGFVWNRPLAILVERDGDKERIPIVDVTLVAQAALLGLTVAFSVGILMLSALRRRV
mgnify:CR=1 FL=1